MVLHIAYNEVYLHRIIIQKIIDGTEIALRSQNAHLAFKKFLNR